MCSLSNWREHSKSLSKLTRIQQKNEQKQRMILNTCISCIQKYLPNSRSRQRLCTVSKQISTIEVNIPRPSPETHGGAPTSWQRKIWPLGGHGSGWSNKCLLGDTVRDEIPWRWRNPQWSSLVHMTCREGADFLLWSEASIEPSLVRVHGVAEGRWALHVAPWHLGGRVVSFWKPPTIIHNIYTHLTHQYIYSTYNL